MNWDIQFRQGETETQISLLVPPLSHIAPVDGTDNCNRIGLTSGVDWERSGLGQKGWFERDGAKWDRWGYLGHWGLTISTGGRGRNRFEDLFQELIERFHYIRLYLEFQIPSICL